MLLDTHTLVWCRTGDRMSGRAHRSTYGGLEQKTITMTIVT